MKGARMDVCAKINKAPRITITTIIGSSQSFLRWRRNAHSSVEMTWNALELIFKRGCVGAGWIARYPIAADLAALGPHSQGIAPKQTLQQTHRCNAQEEDGAQHDGADDFSHQLAQE